MNFLFKLIGTGVTVGATFLAKKIVTKSWEKKTGKSAPTAADDLENTWREALLWGLLTAVTATVIQITAGRGTQHVIHKFGKHSDAVDAA